ncbi:MAG: hypothetical protein AAF985_11490 [Bacteroidota bacterium]
MMNEIEQIERYLNQELSGEALVRFKERLKNDPEWQKQVADYQIIFNGFDVLRKENFAAKLQTWNEEKPLNEMRLSEEAQAVSDEEKKQAPKVRWMPRLVAAASVLIVVSLGIWYFSQTESGLKQFATEQNALVAMHFDTERSIEEEQAQQEQVIEAAAMDYEEKNFSASIQKVETIPSKSPYYLQAQYLLGHSRFQLQAYDKAVMAFEKVLAHEQIDRFKSREEAAWTYLLSLTQVYLQNPNATNANTLKIKLVEQMKLADPNNIYLKREQQLQELLEAE